MSLLRRKVLARLSLSLAVMVVVLYRPPNALLAESNGRSKESLRGRSFSVEVNVSESAKKLGIQSENLESRLLADLFRRGINPKDESKSCLCLTIGILKAKGRDILSWSCSLDFYQAVKSLSGQTWYGQACTWSIDSYGMVGSENVRSIEKVIDDFAKAFAGDYLEVNTAGKTKDN